MVIIMAMASMANMDTTVRMDIMDTVMVIIAVMDHMARMEIILTAIMETRMTRQ